MVEGAIEVEAELIVGGERYFGDDHIEHYLGGDHIQRLDNALDGLVVIRGRRYDQRIAVGRRYGVHVILQLEQVDLIALAAASIPGSIGIAQSLLALAETETELAGARIRIVRIVVVRGICNPARDEAVGGHEAGYSGDVHVLAGDKASGCHHTGDLLARLTVTRIVTALPIRRIGRAGRHDRAPTGAGLMALDRLEVVDAVALRLGALIAVAAEEEERVEVVVVLSRSEGLGERVRDIGGLRILEREDEGSALYRYGDIQFVDQRVDLDHALFGAGDQDRVGARVRSHFAEGVGAVDGLLVIVVVAAAEAERIEEPSEVRTSARAVRRGSMLIGQDRIDLVGNRLGVGIVDFADLGIDRFGIVIVQAVDDIAGDLLLGLAGGHNNHRIG